jgi:hypothetical protein
MGTLRALSFGIVNHDDNSKKLGLIRVRGNSFNPNPMYSMYLVLCLESRARIPSAWSRSFGCR